MTSDRPKKTKQKTVLLALGWYDHRLVEGITAYAVAHNWHIAAASVTQEFIVPWGWRGDGILAWLAGVEELTDFVVSEKLPTVDFSLRRAHLPFAHVVLDHFGIFAVNGTLALDVQEKGRMHFAASGPVIFAPLV